MSKLEWESAGTDEPGDQNAPSTAYPGWWSLGPGYPGGWDVELITTDDYGQETPEGFSLGWFATEAEAKAAAEAAEARATD